MRVRQQESATNGAHHGKDQAAGSHGKATASYGPFEYSERGDQHHEQSVLSHFSDLKAFPESARAKRPVLGVRAKEQEGCKTEKY
jgi:hypothetical protein